MAYVDQTLPLGVAFLVEVLVPSFQFGEGVFEELFTCCLVLSVSVDVQHRRRVEGRLDDARGLAITRGVGATLGVPEVYAGEVVTEPGVDDDLG